MTLFGDMSIWYAADGMHKYECISGLQNVEQLCQHFILPIGWDQILEKFWIPSEILES